MFNPKYLTQLGMKYQTDKSYFHLFTEFYDDYFQSFKDKPITILEIGILEGKSLLMLKEFFPLATIHAIDINPTSVNLKLGDIHTHLCSQTDFNTLNTLFHDITFDIIIEDGSHMTSHQQSSLGFFFSFLNPNGIYICEDLHTSYNHSYIDTSITTLQLFETYLKTQQFKCETIPEEQLNYLNSNVSTLIIHERSMNALVCYKCKQQNKNLPLCLYCNTNLSPSNKSITSILFHKN